MTANHCSQFTLWALIIGINYYPGTVPGTCNRNLRGCVSDARSMEQYLKTAIKNASNVLTLTASTPSEDGGPPAEDEVVWPTYDRVMKHLDQIIRDTRCEDRVYIHYAGHGTRLRQKGVSVCAWSLYEDDGVTMRPLRLTTLMVKLQEMVEKGVLVTLVLDCCFSGGVVRGTSLQDVNIRYVECDAIFRSAWTQDAEPNGPYGPSALRDACMEDFWLVDPRGYMVLAACAPDEYAVEINVNGSMYGAFTYYLRQSLDTLAINGIDITHHTVHEHLCTSVHAHWSRQTPMRYGKKGFALFGDSVLAPYGNSVPIYKDKEDRLILQAGEVHGVFEGDEYFAYLSSKLEPGDNSKSTQVANVQVALVKPFESNLTVTEISCVDQITNGWRAEPRTSFAPRIIRIGMSWGSGAGSRSILQQDFRYMSLIAREHIKEDLGGDSYNYNVIVNARDEYEVVDALQDRLFPFPIIPCRSAGASEVLMDALEHIATFKYFEGVENRMPCPKFRDLFSIESMIPPENDNKIKISNKDRWQISFKNRSPEQLYVGIFNFRASWEVKSLTSATGFLIIPPSYGDEDGERRVDIRMEVPQYLLEVGQRTCEDVIKIFITSKATHFRLALPSILQRSCRRHNDQPTWGDELSAFLFDLNGGFRGQVRSEWATRSFQICTSMD